MGTMESDIFKEEAYDLLDDIEEALLELRDNPADSELINRLFRAFHTIKGSGAMFGFKEVSKFTHEVETAIDKIREGTGVVPDALREVLLTARDQILAMIETEDPDAPEIQEAAQLILKQLAPAVSAKEAPPVQQPPTPKPEPAAAPPVIATEMPTVPKTEPKINKDPDPETQALLTELAELLNEVRDLLQKLHEEPGANKLCKKLHRSIHTVAGTAAMYDMEALAEFSNKLTDITATIKQAEEPVNDEVLKVLTAAIDHCFSLLRSTDPSGQVLQRRSGKITTELEAMVNKDQTSIGTAPETLRFLIVEDEFISRYLLQEFLTPYGNSHVAIDGYEAVLAFKNAIIEKKPYNIVCLDIMMPGLDGRQVAKEIRRLEKEMGNNNFCKIVMTTALDDESIKNELLSDKRCDAYLTKPIRFEDLDQLIKSYFPDFNTTNS